MSSTSRPYGMDARTQAWLRRWAPEFSLRKLAELTGLNKDALARRLKTLGVSTSSAPRPLQHRSGVGPYQLAPWELEQLQAEIEAVVVAQTVDDIRPPRGWQNELAKRFRVSRQRVSQIKRQIEARKKGTMT